MIEIKNCRTCKSDKLSSVLSLGNQYVTNFVESEKEQEKITRIPLELVLCGDCKVLQLRHNAPPEAMWNEQYWYKSAISSTIIRDLKDIVDKSRTIKSLENGDLVVDIGCNDGTLLEFYKGSGIDVAGFEPSGNVAREAASKGIRVVNDFFSAKAYQETLGDKKAKVITAISMFYDLEDPNKFLADIVSTLDENGLLVIQQNYLGTMLANNAFDNICHEHREYYSLIALERLLQQHGLEIFDVEQNDINGGSIRTYIKFRDNKGLIGLQGSEGRLQEIHEREANEGLDTLMPYQEFATRIQKIKEQLRAFLIDAKSKGKRVAIYGASTRGNVALQYFELTPNWVDFATDMNPDKWGKMTVGSLIPIIPPKKMRERHPDYLLVNTWHFFDEIRAQERDYYNSGGRFITALPQFRVI